MSETRVIHGDARDLLRAIDLEGAVVITDPPWLSGGAADIVGAGETACGQTAIGIECDERWIQDAEKALRIGYSQGRLDSGDQAETEQISLHGEET